MKNLLYKSKELESKRAGHIYPSDTGNYDLDIMGYLSFNPI